MPTSIDRTRIIIGIAWMLIVIKSLFVIWAVRHWQIPFHPGWIVVPTVAFGALATGLWLGNRR